MSALSRIFRMLGKRTQVSLGRYLAARGGKVPSDNMAGKIGDPVYLATGLEKRELLAKLAGDCDPFNMQMCKVGKGTADDPIQIKSAFDSRIVGCICNEEAVYPNWMWLHADEPKRCECGRWFCIVPVKAFG